MWLGELTVGLGTVIATFISLVWTALLSAEIFVLYDRSDRAQSEWSSVWVLLSCVSTAHAQSFRELGRRHDIRECSHCSHATSAVSVSFLLYRMLHVC